MHPYLVQTDSLTIRWESVLIIIGIILAFSLAWRLAKPKGEAYRDALLDLCFWLIPAGVIGARLWEVLWTWKNYKAQPLQVFAVWDGGLSIQGALLLGGLAAVLFARRRGLRVWELLDLLAPAALVGQAIGRIGCFLSGDSWGKPVEAVTWWPQSLGVVYAANSPAASIHGWTPLIPAELMEAGADVVILGLLLIAWQGRRRPGQITLAYAAAYSLARFGLEFLRDDSLMFGPFKVAQVLSAVIMLVAIPLFLRRGAVAAKAGVAG
ncbi:MAG TPA: prolipoprotein diacylglyceryl transferase [Symbiobacteriaceae bacterium]|nr:prolipoprotein diacylglyceryl transferase [Symbiobacteriaceae bacterium]